MSMKACIVFVELHVQEVSCPGVWLCPNGEVVLKLHMFGDTFSTAALNPEFPLRYRENFTFRKIFRPMRHLADLQQQLEKQEFYSELIQSNDERSVVLATYETNVSELLFPSPINKALVAGVDVDLLMVATKHFPGILGPKIEISTKMTIEEAFTSDSPSRKFTVINPRMLCSKYRKRNKVKHRLSFKGPSHWKNKTYFGSLPLPLSASSSTADASIIIKCCMHGVDSCGGFRNSWTRISTGDGDSNGNDSVLQHNKYSCEVCAAYNKYFGGMQATEVQNCLCRHYENYSQHRHVQTTERVPDSTSEDKNYRKQFYNNLHDFYHKLYSGIKGSSHK